MRPEGHPSRGSIPSCGTIRPKLLLRTAASSPVAKKTCSSPGRSKIKSEQSLWLVGKRWGKAPLLLCALGAGGRAGRGCRLGSSTERGSFRARGSDSCHISPPNRGFAPCEPRAMWPRSAGERQVFPSRCHLLTTRQPGAAGAVQTKPPVS